MRTFSDHARPHRNEATVKTATPTMKTRRRPNRSAARPPSSRNPPKVIAYAVITHWRLSREKSSASPIDGSATFTIETSRTVMKKAAHTSASAFQRRGSGVVVATASPPSLVFASPNAAAADPIPRGRCRLVAEVAPAGEDHRGAGGAHGLDHLAVALRAAGLDQRSDTGVERELWAVGEREEGVRRKHGAVEVVPLVARLRECEPDGVDAAHLARADPDRAQVLR